MSRRLQRIGFLVATVVVACGISPFAPDALTPPSAPARSLSALGTTTIQSKPTLCATVSGSFANGTPVKLVTCNGTASQQWAASGAGEYRANGSGYCLDTQNASSLDGTIAFIWDCYGPPSQQWVRQATGELRRADGKCLEPQGSRLKTNTALVIYACANKASQKWNAPAAPLDTVTPPPTCQDATATNYGGALPCTYPPPPPTDTNTYVTVLPSQSIQAAVDANPAGTKFKLKAGTFVRQTVTPKGSTLFQGEPGTVMDGENVTPFAFKGHNGAAWVNGVTIRNVTITRYAPPAQNGAIWGGDDVYPATTTGWTLDSVEVSYSTNLGVRIGDRMKVLRSNLHHNSTINIGGVGKAVLVDGTSVTFGNPGCVNQPGFESGGSKFVKTDSLIVRNSTFSDNCGVGLWLDINNGNALLENNLVERNVREGICIEVSLSAVIRNNVVRANGWPTDPYRPNGWVWDAGIGIHATPNVEVYGNTLDENFQGIAIVQQLRDASTGDWYAPPGGFIAQNVYVHHNTIYQRTFGGVNGGDGSAGAGAANDAGDTATFLTRNNRFESNTYYTGSNTYAWAWMNGFRTWAQWRAYGQDATGTNNP